MTGKLLEEEGEAGPFPSQAGVTSIPMLPGGFCSPWDLMLGADEEEPSLEWHFQAEGGGR